MTNPTKDNERNAVYLAGIGIAAVHLGVAVRKLVLPRPGDLPTGPPIGPLEVWHKHTGKGDLGDISKIEDYLTVCVSGSAARYLRSELARSHCKWPILAANFDLPQFCQSWEGRDPMLERAFVIALGYLARVDGGNPEVTLYRLWRRAVQLLYHSPQREQLDRLAHHLLSAQQMTGTEVRIFLVQG